MKTCRKCSVTKTLGEFYSRPNGSPSSPCKECVKANVARYSRSGPLNGTGVGRQRQTRSERRESRIARGLSPYSDAEKAHHVKSIRRHWLDVSGRVAAIKLERGCADCGYRAHPEALDFDHLPGTTKLGALSQMARTSWERIEAEIAKCEVVCANCHRIRTAQRRQLSIEKAPANSGN